MSPTPNSCSFSHTTSVPQRTYQHPHKSRLGRSARTATASRPARSRRRRHRPSRGTLRARRTSRSGTIRHRPSTSWLEGLLFGRTIPVSLFSFCMRGQQTDMELLNQPVNVTTKKTTTFWQDHSRKLTIKICFQSNNNPSFCTGSRNGT